MPKIVETDIAILGGGIAGLWLLNRLRQAGYAAILLESGTLGGGQTHKAQGIIHGGTKYSLQGNITGAAQAIADMPGVWQQCLHGNGEIDLRGVPVLSEHQYLFSTNKLAGKLAGFFAGLALQGKLQALAPEAYPTVFQNVKFKGLVYALDEMAIDTQALVRELVKPHQDVIFKIDPLRDDQLELDAQGNLQQLSVQAGAGEAVQIRAKKYIFTAGAGNEILLRKLAMPGIGMQRRPLHMVVAKTDFDFPVFAHCLGIGATPRITITTHQAHDGKKVWYLGGQIAEEGVQLSSEVQIAIAKKELQELFPWLDFSTVRFASFHVDRAEPLQASGKKPDGVYSREIGNVIIGWPTKLALAPKLADEILACLLSSDVKNEACDTRALRAFPMPALAAPIWDELLC
jgi:glycerol-3-phosphate dehydrogenase